MSILLDRSEPFSSAEFAVIDADRVDVVARRHKLIIDFLEQERYDALLLQNPANMTWFTAGGGFPPGDNNGNTYRTFGPPGGPCRRLQQCRYAADPRFRSLESRLSIEGTRLDRASLGVDRRPVPGAQGGQRSAVRRDDRRRAAAVGNAFAAESV